jgi:hypothetical protein
MPLTRPFIGAGAASAMRLHVRPIKCHNVRRKNQSCGA